MSAVKNRRIDYDNLWLGVTAENQQYADERIPTLLQIPAAHRFVSLEPLLGEIELCDGPAGQVIGACSECGSVKSNPKCECCLGVPSLDWVIVGAETGANARYCPIGNIESVVEQCKAAGVPVWVKAVHMWQMNGKLFRTPEDAKLHCGEGKPKLKIVHKFNELPESVRCRQSPFGEQK